MGEDKNIGERLAGIEVRLTGVDRIESALEKFRDEHSQWRNNHDRDHMEMSKTLTTVDHRSRNDSNRIDALEKMLLIKIDKADAVTKQEFEPIKAMLARIDGHMSWGIKIVLAVILAGVVTGGAFIAKPWEQARNQPHPVVVQQTQQPATGPVGAL